MAKMKTISERMSEILASEDDLKELQSLLQENLVRANQKSQKSFALFATLGSVWILLQISTVEKLSIFGLEFTDIPVLLATIPCLAAFAFYRFVCSEGVVALIDEALRALFKKRFQKAHAEDLTELLTIPTLFHIESSLSNMEDQSSIFYRFSGPWLLILGIFLVGVPVALLVWMFWVVVTLDQLPLSLRIISPCVIALLSFRSVFLFIQWIRNIP